MKPLVVIMGVSGSGKSTIGTLLASALEVPFADADDLHSHANVQKMAAGHPLTDEDRWPWLRLVGAALASADSDGTGLVMACSALKHSYRDAILAVEPHARFVLLDGSRQLLLSRVGHRVGHFMPSGLLDSQLAVLEPLGEGEPASTVSIDQAPDEIVEEIREKLAQL